MATSTQEGSRKLQQLIQRSTHCGGDGEKIAAGLRGRVVEAIMRPSSYGHYVLIAIIKEIGDEPAKEIAQEIRAASGGAMKIAKHERGRLVVRELLIDGKLEDDLLGEDAAYRLVTHKAGHFAVTFEEPSKHRSQDYKARIVSLSRRIMKSVSRHIDECMRSEDGRFYVKKLLREVPREKCHMNACPAYASLLEALLGLHTQTYAEMANHEAGSEILKLLMEDDDLKPRLLQRWCGEGVRSIFGRSKFAREVFDMCGVLHPSPPDRPLAPGCWIIPQWPRLPGPAAPWSSGGPTATGRMMYRRHRPGRCTEYF